MNAYININIIINKKIKIKVMINIRININNLKTKWVLSTAKKTLNMSIINRCRLKGWFREVVYQFLIPGHYLTSWTSMIATQIYRFIEMGSQLKGFSRCAVRSFITSFWGTPGLWGDWRVGFWSRVGVIQGPPPQYFGFMTGGGNVSMTKGAKFVG